MEIVIRVDFGLISAVFFALTLFGVLYNALISYAERKRYLEGFVSLLVAAGVLATLGGFALVSWKAALLCLVFFVASGLPMMAGSIIRYILQREQAQRGIRDDRGA